MMGIEQIGELMERTGLPVAYQQFDDEEENLPEPPYIVYYETRSSNFGADNTTYAEKIPFIIELYTDYCRDLALEKNIKDLLQEAKIFYNTDHAQISEEKAHIAYFEGSMLI